MTVDTITSFGWGEVAIIDDEYSEDQMKTSTESTAFWFVNLIKVKEWGGSVPFLRGIGDSETSSDYESDEAENDDDGIVETFPATKGERKPTVRFSNVQIREYELTIGDHPCTNLYPLSLDWSHSELETISIEDHIADRVLKLDKRKSVDPRKTGRRAFRLDAANRVARLHTVTSLRILDLYSMERARHARIREDKHRAAIGLPSV
jgi:hypothetical protein